MTETPEQQQKPLPLVRLVVQAMDALESGWNSVTTSDAIFTALWQLRHEASPKSPQGVALKRQRVTHAHNQDAKQRDDVSAIA